MSIHSLCFVDVETTGHDPLKLVNGELLMWHEIIDFAAIFVNPRTLDYDVRIALHVEPKHPERCLPDLINHYPERAAAGEWKGALPLANVLHQFLRLCEDQKGKVVLVGQNFFFDWSFISVGFAQSGISESEWGKVLHYSRLDTRSMAVQAYLAPGEVYNPDEFSFRNGRLTDRLGIDPEPMPHRAMNGALRAFMAYKALLRSKKTKD